jgi:transcriptional regulator GlxA family with amidase domain
MTKAKLEIVKKVIQQSRLSNKMVAEAFGYKNADNLNVEFLDTFGFTLTEFRERCKQATGTTTDQDNQQLG